MLRVSRIIMKTLLHTESSKPSCIFCTFRTHMESRRASKSGCLVICAETVSEFSGKIGEKQLTCDNETLDCDCFLVGYLDTIMWFLHSCTTSDEESWQLQRWEYRLGISLKLLSLCGIRLQMRISTTDSTDVRGGFTGGKRGNCCTFARDKKKIKLALS